MVSPKRVDVAVVSRQQTWLELLHKMFELHGLQVATCCLSGLASDRQALISSLADHQPRVLVYELSGPYAESLAAAEAILRDGRLGDCRTVLTVQDRDAMLEQLGEVDVLEVRRDVSELAQLGRTVREALQAGASV